MSVAASDKMLEVVQCQEQRSRADRALELCREWLVPRFADG